MTIKEQIDHINQQMMDLTNLREEIQEKCTHENSEEVQYTWRAGSTIPATVCSDCGKFLRSNL